MGEAPSLVFVAWLRTVLVSLSAATSALCDPSTPMPIALRTPWSGALMALELDGDAPRTSRDPSMVVRRIPGDVEKLLDSGALLDPG